MPRETYRENGQYVLGADDLQTFGSDYGRILSEDVKLETYHKDGKRAGIKVREVKPGSLAARHGVQAEDILISINGSSVTSEQEAIQYVKNNSENTTLWRVTFHPEWSRADRDLPQPRLISIERAFGRPHDRPRKLRCVGCARAFERDRCDLVRAYGAVRRNAQR